MKILLDNLNLGSTSGPNSFGRQLTEQLKHDSHDVMNTIELSKVGNKVSFEPPDIQLTFIEAMVRIANVPLVQRLDGIYYNSDSQYGDWWIQNQRIKDTYDRATGIIFQSPFSKRLVETFFDAKPDDQTTIIGNGVNLEAIALIPVLEDPVLDPFDDVWMCASSWRPHKRLSENIRYFLEAANDNDAMIVAGAANGPYDDHDRVIYVGELNWQTLIACYKRASTFVHLAYHDNCPNVVVDARAAGCKIICASCAGSSSIAGSDAIVIEEEDWIPQPIELYKPPRLNFDRARRNGIESSIDIIDVTRRYIEFLKRIREMK